MTSPLRLRHRTITWAWMCVTAGMLTALAVPLPQASPPATHPVLTDLQQKAVRRMAGFYAEVYGLPLSSTERLPREIGILSLSRLDEPEVTARLLEAFAGKDHDPVVEYLAWEALHSRNGELDAKQRHAWIVAGLKAAGEYGAFPGVTVMPLLRVLAEENPIPLEDKPRKLANRVIRENDLETVEGKAALTALRDLVSTWHSTDLARAISTLLRTPDLALRADYVLRGLPEAPAVAERAKLTAAWETWLTANAKLAPASGAELKRYAGVGGVFPPPEPISDPSDKRWRAELEINKVTVSDFDLVWCIDSTGSMAERNQRVAAETRLLAHVCSLVSRRVRCGTIYYRHETQADLEKQCCLHAKTNPKFYQVKGFPLTTDAKALSTSMAAERIPKPDSKNEGNTHPGCAVHAAIKAAMTQMNWSADHNARRAIVLVGDSAPTPGTEAACELIAAQAKTQGYILDALVVGEAETTWGKFLTAADGEMVPLNAQRELMVKAETAAERRAIRLRAATNPSDPFADVVSEILRHCVDPAYRDRVDPLLHILRPYAKAVLAVEQATKAR